MTRVNLDHVQDFNSLSNEELAAAIQNARVFVDDEEIHLGEADIISEDDLEFAEPLFDFTEAEWIGELDLAFEQASTPANRFERGVGFCENVRCNDYLKGVFLMLHEGDDFECGTCNTRSSHMVAERGIPDREGNIPFTTVKVEYCYEPAQKRFVEFVAITDESYEGPGGTYTILNPLCKTPNRAAKIAESMLTVINAGVSLDDDLFGDVPRTHETILSFDKPTDEFRKDLKDLEHNLRDNSFLQRTTSVVSTPIEVELNLEEGDSSGPESNNAGGTTDPQPRVSPSGDSGTRALHIHPSDQPGGIRPQRSEGGLHPLQPVGTRSASLRRRASEGRRGRSDRAYPSKLRAAARRYLASFLRNTGRGSTPGT
jgi:hypothetical protein